MNEITVDLPVYKVLFMENKKEFASREMGEIPKENDFLYFGSTIKRVHKVLWMLQNQSVFQVIIYIKDIGIYEIENIGDLI